MDAICDRDFGDENGMAFIFEHVGDTFAAIVAHDDFDASRMLEGQADVPCVHCMKTPQQSSIEIVLYQYFGAYGGHWCCIEEEGPFECFEHQESWILMAWTEHVDGEVSLISESTPICNREGF